MAGGTQPLADGKQADWRASHTQKKVLIVL